MLLVLTLACAVTHHPLQTSSLGVPRTVVELEALLEQPGPVTVETVTSADWDVPLSGLLDLEDPRAVEAGLTDRPEPIQVSFHAIHHPERGLFLVDTGVERALSEAPEAAAIRGFIASQMHTEKLDIQAPLGVWLAGRPVAGVFMTHLHLDHISGMPDVPRDTPIYSGPGEARARDPLNLPLRPTVGRLMEGKGTIQEWNFDSDPQEGVAGVLDIFGDGSVFALWSPGHTPGSTAYVARTPAGPVLLTGDVCHTRWGWENGVGPGSFSADREAGLESLEALRALAARHPTMEVRLGHQR